MKKKKVALIGNMNNNHFPILRFLLMDGLDVTLVLLDSEHDHFLPDNDTFGDLDFPIKKSRLSVLPSSFWSLAKSEIKKILDPFDVLIGTGPAPAFCSRINRKLNLFIPYGADMYSLPFFKSDLSGSLRKGIKRKFLARHQRRGIKMCERVMMDMTNVEFEGLFMKLDIKEKRVFCNPPYIYTPEFSPVSISSLYSKSHYFRIFKKVRDEHELVIFQHSRQEWDESEAVFATTTKYTKGNQKLIYAFAEFLETTKLRAHLILFEYGTTFQRSKELVTKLKIDEHVTWMPQMPRKEIMIGISLCDIGVGELDSSYFSYGAVYEFLAMAKPVIHYRNDELYKDNYSTMYPMYSANSKEQVFQYFVQYEANPESFKKTGLEAYEWFKKNAIELPLENIKKIIDTKSSS